MAESLQRFMGRVNLDKTTSLYFVFHFLRFTAKPFVNVQKMEMDGG